MSSFATDVVVAQKPLCERDTIEYAVDTLKRELRKSASAEREQTGDPGDTQMKLALAGVNQGRKQRS